MLKEPLFPEKEWEGSVQLCFDGETLFAEFDAPALVSFRWYLWFLAAKCPRDEDISIEANGPECCTQGHAAVDYCEITMTGEGPLTDIVQVRRAEFLHRGKRVDLFVDRTQAVEAYRLLGALNSGDDGRQVTLFGRLAIRLRDASPGAA